MSRAYLPFPDDMRHVMLHTEGLWEELRGQGVFVTGGTGFVGRWLLESLLWANDRLSLRLRVVVLSRRPEAFARSSPQLADHPMVSLLRGDCRTFDFPDGEYSHVLHIAKESEPAASALGTQRILEFAASHGTANLLFTSSGAVYGPQPHDLERLGEDYAGTSSLEDRHADYALGKRTGERLCSTASAASQLHVAIARCFTFVGPTYGLRRRVRHRQLHPRRGPRRCRACVRRRLAPALVSLRSRPHDLAVDHPVHR